MADTTGKVPDKNNANNTQKKTSMFEALVPLIGTAISGITSLFGKNAEADKAKTELQTAQQAVLAEKEKTKQAGYTVDVEKLKLLEARELTAQNEVNNTTSLAKQKQSIGLLTIGFVLVFLFGIGFLFVKFVLPIFFPKSSPSPQNVVIQDN